MSFGKCQFPVNSETEIHGNHTDFHINWHFLTFFDIFSWKCHIFPHLFNREIHFSCYSPGKFPHLPWFCTHIIVTFAHIFWHFLTFFDIFWHFWHCTHIHLPANVIWYRPVSWHDGEKKLDQKKDAGASSEAAVAGSWTKVLLTTAANESGAVCLDGSPGYVSMVYGCVVAIVGARYARNNAVSCLLCFLACFASECSLCIFNCTR